MYYIELNGLLKINLNLQYKILNLYHPCHDIDQGEKICRSKNEYFKNFTGSVTSV